MKIIYSSILFLCLICSIECSGEELIQGEIIATTQNKLSITTGEKAIANLGKKDWVIKGDIFKISEAKDPDLKGPIGMCAVLETRDNESTCEIIKMSKEVRKGNIAFIKKINFSDKNLYGIIFDMLNKMIEPYESYKQISIYISNFYDDKNNITAFSELLKNEIKYILLQKGRINLINDDRKKGFFLYPEEYVNIKFIEDSMKRDNIDILMTGSYKVNNENIEMTIFLIDKNYDDQQLKYTLKLNDYNKYLSEMVIPYKPIERKEVVLNLFYKPLRYAPQKDEKYYFINQEAEKNPFIKYSLGRIDFNIISPVNFKIQIDNNIIAFDGKNDQRIVLLQGSYKLFAFFRRAFYFNDTIIYTSLNDVKKEIQLTVDKGGEINIDLNVNPLYERENIEFKIYKKTEKQNFILKPIYRTETTYQVEAYKD